MGHARRAALAAALLSLAGGAASAHVTLETEQAPAGSTYKAVLRVGHGCEGKPTTAVRVKIPEGVIAVKPMPKPGWQLATVKGKYEQTYDYYGTPLSEGVTEIAWTGGDLPDEWYDEFAFRGQLAGAVPGAVVYFPVVQECTDGAVHRWIEIPEPGRSAEDYEEPAPGVTVVEKPAG
jgi:periplasmic copper chaperone A